MRKKTRKKTVTIVNKTPDYLYRYRDVSKEHSFHELEHSELYFSSPKDFNDPFDCHNLFSFDGATDRDWRNLLDIIFKVNEPELSEILRSMKIDAIIKSGHTNNQTTLNGLREEWDSALNSHNNEYGIVCMSSRNNDILMWSHYSDGHKGYCLKFNSKILSQLYFGKEVSYRNSYPKLKEFIGDEQISNLLISTKSAHWKYEKEYRYIISPVNEVRNMKFPTEALEGVIFGCNISEESKEKIKALLKSNGFEKASVHQAVKAVNTYSLKIEQL